VMINPLTSRIGIPVRFDVRDVETEHSPDREAPAAERAGNR
jgi:hypothetical protein